MKKVRLLLIISAIFIVGCEKSYTCVITTPGLANPYEYEFKGTHNEMKEFENSGIPGQEIECK